MLKLIWKQQQMPSRLKMPKYCLEPFINYYIFFSNFLSGRGFGVLGFWGGATHLRYLYKVHELHPSSSSVNAEIAQQKLEGNVRHPQEILGKNILPGPDGVWNHIPFSNKDVDTFAVHAVGLRHSQKISSTGFILKETDYPGNFEDPDKVLNLIQSDESRKRLPKRYQKHPHEIFNELKRGVAIEGVLSPTDVLGPTKPGRKIVILGDTFDASTAASMSAGATVVVHEATNGALSNLEKSNENETKKVIARTIMHGHSTPEMAGAFAQAVGACVFSTDAYIAPVLRFRNEVSKCNHRRICRIGSPGIRWPCCCS